MVEEGISTEGIMENMTCDFNPGDFIQSGQLYEDKEFPAADASLYKVFGSTKQPEWADFEWKHADDIFGKDEYCIFSGIGPNDIEQGSLGDCYFLSALSALAEFPDRVKKIFLTEQVNKSDLYAVNMFVNGAFQMVVMDAMFPYNTPYQCPAFSKSKNKELWVMLAEKAFSKVNGNYENIIAGEEAAALRALTGAPCEYLTHKNLEPEVIYNKIFNANARNFVICGGAGMPGMSGEEYQALGLVSYHAYAITSAVRLETDQGTVQLIQLRNPWGQFEWKGDWSDSSDLWTSDLKAKAGWTEADDGTFFMCLDDYLRYYGNTSICKVHDDYVNNSFTVQHASGDYTLLKFAVEEPTCGYISSNQFKKRVLRNKYPEYDYSPCMMLLGKMEEDGHYTFIDETYGRNYSQHLDFPGALEPGDYVAYIQVDWRYTGMDSLTLNTYTDVPLNIEILEKADHPKLLGELLHGAARARKAPERPIQIKDFEYQGDATGILNFTIGFDFGYYVVFANTTEDKTLEGNFEYQLKNLEFTDCDPKISLNLGPGEVVVKKMKIISYKEGYGFGTGMSYLIR